MLWDTFNKETGRSHRSGFGAAFVALFSLLLLASVIQIPDLIARLILAASFIAFGIGLRVNANFSYLILLALYPLIPSHLSQLGLPEFSAAEFVFLCFAFWWAVYKIIDHKPVFTSSFVRPLLAYQFAFLCLSTFLALSAVSFFLSRVFLLSLKDHWNFFVPWDAPDPFAPARSLLTQAEGLLFFFISLDFLNDAQKIQRALKVIFYTAAVVAVLGVLQYIFRFQLLDFWVKENPNLIRINSTMDDPNSLGTYLAAVFCIGIFWESIAQSSTSIAKTASFVIILVTLWMTGSRSALFGLCISLLAVALLMKRAGYSTRRIAKNSAIGLVTLVTLIAITSKMNYSVDKPTNWVEFVLNSTNFSRPSTVLEGRIALWQTAIRVFGGHPLLGAGQGSFLQQIATRPWDYPELQIVQNVHNYFLQLLAETGIFGLALFLLILFVLIKPVLTQTREEAAIPGFPFIGAILIVLLASVTGHPLLLFKLQLFFWGTIAIIYATTNQEGKQPPSWLKKILVAMTLLLLVAIPWQVWKQERSRNFSVFEAGYYDWERDANGNLFRWTKSQASSDLLRQGDSVSFSVRQIGEPLQKGPWPVDVLVNGHLQRHIILADQNWQRVDYALESRERRVMIQIKSPNVFSPADFGMNDSRQLGVEVSPFHWQCASKSAPAILGVFRSADRIVQVSALRLEPYKDADQLQVSDPSGQALSMHANASDLFATSSSIPLYAPVSLSASYRVDGSHSLEIRKDLSGKNILFRLQARSLFGSKVLPLIYVRANGKQVLKIPILNRNWNSYFFELPGPISEMSLSNWDGLSENSKAIDTPVQILELRAWASDRRFNSNWNPGWFQTRQVKVPILERGPETAKYLTLTGDSYSVEKNWIPGIADLVITARAQLAGKDVPLLAVYLARRKVADIAITNPDLQEYRIQIPVGGTQQIQLIYENDYWDSVKHEDRNIILKAMALEYHPTIVTTQEVLDPVSSPPPCLNLEQKGK